MLAALGARRAARAARAVALRGAGVRVALAACARAPVAPVARALHASATARADALVSVPKMGDSITEGVRVQGDGKTGREKIRARCSPRPCNPRRP